MRKFYAIVALILCLGLLCACSNKDPQNDQSGAPATIAPAGELSFSVSVIDSDGSPVTSGVVVSFLSGDQVVGMQTVNELGVAEKVLPAGAYTVSLDFTDSSVSAYFDTSELVLDAKNTSVTVTLAQALGDQFQTISAYSLVSSEHKNYDAYYIQTGTTFVPLDSTDRNYFLFVPTEPGMYAFSVSEGAVLGYYGSTFFVQSNHLEDYNEDGSFQINVSPGMIGSGNTGTSVFVLGVDSADDSCMISVRRTGDAELTLEDYPWNIYTAQYTPAAYVLPGNVSLGDFDLTAATDTYHLVLNEKDGYYHLDSENGPIVYAKLGVNSEYLDSIEIILESSGISRYYFDENGNFLKKVSFSECLLEYIGCMDEKSGLYPLTPDLMYIFQERGNYVGWWDESSSLYLFKDSDGNPIPGINPEIAWLFLCCYGEVPVDPCADGHTAQVDPAKEATCTKDGLTEGSHCATCGEVIVPQETVKATGHSYGSWKIVKEATESAEGQKERTCKNCGNVEKKTIEKLKPNDPCAEGHSYGDWKTTKEPTYTATGTAERKCTVCGEKQTKTLDKRIPTENVPGEKVTSDPTNADAPTELGGAGAKNFTADLAAGESQLFHLYRISGSSLTIESDCAYVIYEGTIYWPKNGTISVPIVTESIYVPAEVIIGNFGLLEDTFSINCEYPLGSNMNPAKLEMGSFTTNLTAGDEDGYEYTYTASAAGKLTITVNNCSADGICCISVTTTANGASVQVNDDNTDGTLTISIDLVKRQKVQIIISVYTDSNEYPAATIEATASFE